MPSQKPLIDLDKLDRNRGEQLKAIDGLAARLQPGIARDGYSVSVQALVSLMTKFDSLTSPQRPYTWHGIAHWSGMTGLSPKQCSRAISVLQSLQLIEARVTWVSHGKRGMKIRINWSTVFTTGPITQDAEDLALWTTRKTRQRTLFTPRRTPKPTPVVSVSETDTMSVSETDTMSVSETDTMSVSTISHPQTYSLNHSLAGAKCLEPSAQGQRGEGGSDFDSVFSTERANDHGNSKHTDSVARGTCELSKRGGSFSGTQQGRQREGGGSDQSGLPARYPRGFDDDGRDSKRSQHHSTDSVSEKVNDSTTETRRHGDEEKQQSIRCAAASTGIQRILSTADHRSARVTDVADVPPGQLFQFSNPSADQTVLTTVPAEFDSIVKRLISLGVADGRSAVRKSLTAGYTPTGITAILDWYQAEALPDEHGKLVYPYDPGQLVLRLRDRDAIAAEPAQGNWQGGKSGFWTRLAPISTPKPRKQPLPATPAPKPDRIPVQMTYSTTLSHSELSQALDIHHAPATVRQSSYRWTEGGPLPKTLARWMKTVGLPVDESQPGGKE